VNDRIGTWIGDANLDGEFNSTDLVLVFQAGRYERLENSNWSQGDWNGDQLTNSSDLVAAFRDGGYEKGPRVTVAAVPEPTSLMLTTLIIGLVIINCHRYRITF
jgi:hypothetical protein